MLKQQQQQQSQPSSSPSSLSMRSVRLMREWREMERCPVENVSICPLNESNLSEWHGNIRGADTGTGSSENDNDNDWKDIVVHFSIIFPLDYPIRPPRVRLCSFVPHLNIQHRNGFGWEVCLDMLELQPIGSLTTPYRYWSSAFSVRSILVQMTSFLLVSDHPTQTATGNIERTKAETREFICSSCNHSQSNPSPPFPSLQDVMKAPLSFPSVEVSGDSVELLQSRLLQRKIQFHQEYVEKTKKTIEIEEETNLVQKPETEIKIESTTIITSSPSDAEKENEIDKEKQNDGTTWNVVKSKKYSQSNSTQKSIVNPSNLKTPSQTQTSKSSQKKSAEKVPAVKIEMKYKCKWCRKKLSENCFTRSQLNKGEERKCLECTKSIQPNSLLTPPSPSPIVNPPPASVVNSKIVGAPPSLPTKANGTVDQNFLRRQKKREAKSKSKMEKEIVQEVQPIPKTPTPTQQIEELVQVPINEEKEESNEQISSQFENLVNNEEKQEVGEWKNIWRVSPETAVRTNKNMGLFRTLNRDTSLILLSYLELNDILAFGTACRGTSSLCDDWLVWRDLLTRRYPRTSLTPTGPNSSWKIAFQLESNCLSQDLMCFASFETKSTAILGFPISFTTNPKTGCLDHATSTFDILSYNAFISGNIRKTIWGERFTDFLPIYLDETHFKKGLPQLIRVSRKIVQAGLLNQSKYHNHYNNKYSMKNHHNKYSSLDKLTPPEGGAWIPQNDAEMIFCLLTKMMNTQVVLLCDKGIAASEVALMGYCQLHRLLLAVVEHFPHLRLLIRKRLYDFAQIPETRVKSFTPSLGEFLAMLSVSDTYSWKQLSLAYIKESFDRSVLWACSKDPSLAEVIPGDESRLSKYLTTQRVGMRLTLFHAVFLNLLVQGGGSRMKLADCMDRYDTFQGRPPLHVRREWQNAVKSILEFDSWPQYFAISGIPLPMKSFLLSTLEKSVSNSLKKGYHSRDTVFQNVMKSGVSQILLKGETYSAAPNLREIQMIESWRFDGPVVYLDASCLVYDFQGQHLATADYQTTSINHYSQHRKRSEVCIEHSGDIIDPEAGVGKHVITVHVSRLPEEVASLFFTVSAWTTSLGEIHQPSAHLFDAVSDAEMCRYKLEDEDTGDMTAVIMCKLHRSSPTSRWQMTSIGHVGYGRAGSDESYRPICGDIQHHLSSS